MNSVEKRGKKIPEVHHFLPLITHSFPSFTIEDWIFVASDEATYFETKSFLQCCNKIKKFRCIYLLSS